MSPERTFNPRTLMREGFEDLFARAAEDEGAFIFVKGTGSGSGFAMSKYPQFAGKYFQVKLVEAEACEQPSE